MKHPIETALDITLILACLFVMATAITTAI